MFFSSVKINIAGNITILLIIAIITSIAIFTIFFQKQLLSEEVAHASLAIDYLHEELTVSQKTDEEISDILKTTCITLGPGCSAILLKRVIVKSGVWVKRWK